MPKLKAGDYIGPETNGQKGKWKILSLLGEGGMGAVYEARNWKLDRVVALKLMRKERLANPDAIRRFLNAR